MNVLILNNRIVQTEPEITFPVAPGLQWRSVPAEQSPQPQVDWLYNEEDDSYSEPPQHEPDMSCCLRNLEKAFNDYIAQRIPKSVIDILPYMYRQADISQQKKDNIDAVYGWYSAVVALYLTWKIEILDGGKLIIAVTNFSEACDKTLGAVKNLQDCLELMGSS